MWLNLGKYSNNDLKHELIGQIQKIYEIGEFLSFIQGTSATLVGSKETIMHSFFNNYNFKKVRGTAAGVSYNRITREPEPQFFFQRWTIFER